MTSAGIAYISPPVCDVLSGPFLMGSTIVANEAQPRRVTLKTYSIGKYPVTVAEYLCFIKATDTLDQIGRAAWHAQLAKLNHPVVSISWRDALAYTVWLSSVTGQSWRLPRKQNGRRQLGGIPSVIVVENTPGMVNLSPLNVTPRRVDAEEPLPLANIPQEPAHTALMIWQVTSGSGQQAPMTLIPTRQMVREKVMTLLQNAFGGVGHGSAQRER